MGLETKTKFTKKTKGCRENIGGKETKLLINLLVTSECLDTCLKIEVTDERDGIKPSSVHLYSL